MASALRLRASAMLFTPSLDRKVRPFSSASLSDGILRPEPPSDVVCSGAKELPLIAMTRWNSPLASGLTARMLTAPEPAECPNDGDVVGIAAKVQQYSSAPT